MSKQKGEKVVEQNQPKNEEKTEEPEAAPEKVEHEYSFLINNKT